MVHLTETCDEDMPRLVVNTDTTPANVHEAPRTGPIHDALAAKGPRPNTLVTKGHLAVPDGEQGVGDQAASTASAS